MRREGGEVDVEVAVSVVELAVVVVVVLFVGKAGVRVFGVVVADVVVVVNVLAFVVNMISVGVVLFVPVVVA